MTHLFVAVMDMVAARDPHAAHTPGTGPGPGARAGTPAGSPLPPEAPGIALPLTVRLLSAAALTSSLCPRGLCPRWLRPASCISNRLVTFDVGLPALGGGRARSAHGGNWCVHQITSGPAGLRRARRVSALTFHIAIMKSLPKINAACVMSNRVCVQGGKCTLRHGLASTSLFVTVTGRPVTSSGIFWLRRGRNKCHKYPGKCSARHISFI